MTVIYDFYILANSNEQLFNVASTEMASYRATETSYLNFLSADLIAINDKFAVEFLQDAAGTHRMYSTYLTLSMSSLSASEPPAEAPYVYIYFTREEDYVITQIYSIHTIREMKQSTQRVNS